MLAAFWSYEPQRSQRGRSSVASVVGGGMSVVSMSLTYYSPSE